jgi:hypothetical protein
MLLAAIPHVQSGISGPIAEQLETESRYVKAPNCHPIHVFGLGTGPAQWFTMPLFQSPAHPNGLHDV